MPMYILNGLQQVDRLESKEQLNDTFIRAAFFMAHCIIGTEEKSNVGLNCDFLNHKCFQAYGDIVYRFRPLSIDNIQQPFIT